MRPHERVFSYDKSKRRSAGYDHFPEPVFGQEELHGMEVSEQSLEAPVVKRPGQRTGEARQQPQRLMVLNLVAIDGHCFALGAGVKETEEGAARLKDRLQAGHRHAQDFLIEELEGVPDQNAVEVAGREVQVLLNE